LNFITTSYEEFLGFFKDFLSKKYTGKLVLMPPNDNI